MELNIDKYLMNPEIKKLHLTKDEISVYRPYIIKQVDDYLKCQKDESDKCVNPDFRHIKLYRDEKTNKIKIGYTECPKAKIHKYWLWLDIPTKTNEAKWSMNNLINNVKLMNNDKSNKREFIDKYLTPVGLKVKHNELNKTKGIYLFGDYGVGKSLLLYLFCKMCVEKYNLYTAFTNTGMLYKRIKQTFDKSIEAKKENSEDIVNILNKADVLVLDDLGVVESKYFYTSILWEIIDYRYRNNKLTFFTSNFSLNELKKFMVKNLNIASKSALRIVDRIEALSTAWRLIDINFRKVTK